MCPAEPKQPPRETGSDAFWVPQWKPTDGGNPATADARRLLDEVVPLVNAAGGASWYEDVSNAVDAAAAELCRLRRAGAGGRGSPLGGDDAVRAALGLADPEAVIWLTSRLVSYADEQGFPEALDSALGQ